VKRQGDRRIKKLRPGESPGGAHWSTSGNVSSDSTLTLPVSDDLLGEGREETAGHSGRSRSVWNRSHVGSTASWLAAAPSVAAGLAAAVAGVASGLTAAVGAAVATLLGRVERLEETEELVLLAATGVAAAVASVAGGLAAAIGVAARLAAAIASVTSGLAAAVASVTSRLAAAVFAAAVVLRLALREQALQPAEKFMLLTASGVAAAAASIASGLAASVPCITSWLAAAIGIAARLAAAIASITGWLTTRITAAVVAEHPVKELETIRLATNGRTEGQHAEVQHTLHRATSPLLVDQARF
jgi:MFS family permease